jgi:phage FluMu protein Com
VPPLRKRPCEALGIRGTEPDVQALLDRLQAEVKQMRCTRCGARAEPCGFLLNPKLTLVLKCPRCSEVWEIEVTEISHSPDMIKPLSGGEEK